MADDRYEDVIDETRDLAVMSCLGRLMPVVYRDAEVAKVIGHLTAGRSVLVVGPPGVGKTAVLHGVVRPLSESHNLTLREVSTTAILSGTRYLGEWQTKVTRLAKAAAGSSVLYFTDIANLAHAGRSSSTQTNLLDALRPFIESKELQIAGEVTPETLRAMERLPGFADLFERVAVAPLSAEHVDHILIAGSAVHRLGLDAASRAAVTSLTSRFLPARPQPGPGLALLEQLRHYLDQKEDIGEAEAVTPEFVERVFSIYSGLPRFIVSRAETRPLREIRTWFQERIVGQQAAIEAVVEAITLFKAGLHDPTRPIGTFLFVGPTGVGKTELARALATFLFGSAHRLLRFDLSEFKDYSSFEMLIGDPENPDRPARLVDPVRGQPFQVVLLDELEKAHVNIRDLLLPVLDEGHLTPPGGEAVGFRNTILIATSNVGAQHSERSLGFASVPGASEREAAIRRELELEFRPEFLNRFQHIVVFHPLTEEQLRLVARQELRRVLGREGIAGRNLVVDVEDAALDVVIRRGVDPRYGARALKREIQRQIVLPLAMALTEREAAPGTALRVVAKEGQVRVRVIDTPESRAIKREAAPIRLPEGRKVTRKDIAAGLDAARRQIDALADEVDEPFLLAERQRLDELRRTPEFWHQPGHAAGTLADLDRATTTTDRLDTLRVRCDEVSEALAAAITRADLERAGNDLVRLEGALATARRELVLMGPDGAWDALVEVRPSTGGNGRLARDHVTELYSEWAAWRGLEVDVLHEPLSDDDPVWVAFKGPYAHGLLKLEAGLHRVRDEETVGLATVRVGPWDDRSGPVVFGTHRALKAIGQLGGKIRSRLECDGGLVLQNARTLAENRDLAPLLAAPWREAPPPPDEMVRRYDLTPPLVRDVLADVSWGKPDALAPKGLHELLCTRVEIAAKAG